MAADDHIKAHHACFRHRAQLMASESCGYFYCLETFAPDAIEEWVDDGQTALCPCCGIDSVIGSASGYPVDRDFLSTMQQRWFGADGSANAEKSADEEP
jgi:hypothetical protein